MSFKFQSVFTIEDDNLSMINYNKVTSMTIKEIGCISNHTVLTYLKKIKQNKAEEPDQI